jgi:hypothetical protein
MTMRRIPAVALLAAALLSCHGGSGPTAPPAEPITVEDVTEALFLNAGRASEGGVLAGVWEAFPRGSAVRLVVASSVNREALSHLRRQVAELNGACGGYMSFGLVESADPDPRPGPGEITLAEVDPALLDDTTGEPGAGGTCREVGLAGPVILSARCLIRRGNPRVEVFVHEVGHGLGFFHLRDGVVPAMMNPSAPVTDFTDLELEAIRRVYSSGLEPGATRADFASLGLVRRGG